MSQSPQRQRQNRPSSPTPATPAAILDTTNRVGRIVQETRAGVTALQPLLELLDEPEAGGEESPIEELKGLLEAILLNQRHMSLAIEDLQQRIDVIGFAVAPRSAFFAASRQAG